MTQGTIPRQQEPAGLAIIRSVSFTNCWVITSELCVWYEGEHRQGGKLCAADYRLH
jgi:hypothetical protein